MVSCWRTTSGRLLQILGNDADNVTSVIFSPDGKTLASGNYSSNTHLWDVESGTLLQTLGDHEGGVAGVAFRPDGTILASGNWDGTIVLWGL